MHAIIGISKSIQMNVDHHMAQMMMPVRSAMDPRPPSQEEALEVPVKHHTHIHKTHASKHTQQTRVWTYFSILAIPCHDSKIRYVYDKSYALCHGYHAFTPYLKREPNRTD